MTGPWELHNLRCAHESRVAGSIFRHFLEQYNSVLPVRVERRKVRMDGSCLVCKAISGALMLEILRSLCVYTIVPNTILVGVVSIELIQMNRHQTFYQARIDSGNPHWLRGLHRILFAFILGRRFLGIRVWADEHPK
jgi:hypothetical protein